MFITKPEKNVLDFELIEWLVEDEPCPKKALRDFMEKRYEEITNKKVKESGADEDGEYEDEVGENYRDWMIDATYKHYSISEDGNILLFDEGSNGNLYITDADAQKLKTILRKSIEERVANLNKLLK